MIHSSYLTPRALAQFASKVEKRAMHGNPCLRWLAAHNDTGKPVMGVPGEQGATATNAYRVAAVLGRVPGWENLLNDEEWHVHHTCGHRWCVNASHLEVLTPAEHHRRHNPDLPEGARIIR